MSKQEKAPWEDWKESELRRIPIDIVHPSTILPERSYTKELTGDIYQPLQVRKSPIIEGYFEIWDGEKRWLKLRKLEEADEILWIDAIFHDLTDEQVFSESLRVNDEHDTNTAYGKAIHYETEMKHFGIETYEELAEKVGVSKSTMSLYRGILKLIKAIEEKLVSLEKFNAVNFLLTKHALSAKQYQELLRLKDHPESLVSIWWKLEKNPEIAGKELTKLVDNELPEAEEEPTEEAEEEEEVEERAPKRKPKRKKPKEEEEVEEGLITLDEESSKILRNIMKISGESQDVATYKAFFEYQALLKGGEAPPSTLTFKPEVEEWINKHDMQRDELFKKVIEAMYKLLEEPDTYLTKAGKAFLIKTKAEEEEE